MRRFLAASAVFLMIGLLVIACGGATPTATAPATSPAAPRPTATPPTQATPTAAPTPTPSSPVPTPTATLSPTATPAPRGLLPRRGGTLKQGSFGEAGFFLLGLTNPQFGVGTLFAGALMYQPLFQQDPYNNNVLAGLLAEKWAFSPNGDQVTIQLKRDARWSDGKPVIAEDVKFALGSYGSPPKGFAVTGPAKTVGQNIAKIEILDDKALRMDLKSPDVSLLAYLADPNVPVVPAHRTLEQSTTDPIGSGPYVLKGLQIDIKSNFLKNPNYWQRDASGTELPYLDGVENIVLDGPARVTAAFYTGSVDLFNTIWGPIFEQLATEIKKRLPQATVQTRNGGNRGWGFKNTPPYNNPLFLRAMSIVTDRLAIIELGFARDAVIDAIATLPASTGSEWALPMKEILSHPGWRYVSKTTGELETDITKLRAGLSAVYKKDPADIALAKDLLKQAGMDPDKGQFPRITLTSSDRYESLFVVIAQTIKQYLGVDAVIDLADFATFSAKQKNGLFPVAIVSPLYGSTVDPSPIMQTFTTGNGLWKHDFQVPELDSLFDQQKRATDPVRRRAIVWEFQRKFLAQPHIIPGANAAGGAGAVQEWVKNMPAPVVTYSNVFDLDRVWLERRS